jgi:hypothetical protein
MNGNAYLRQAQKRTPPGSPVSLNGTLGREYGLVSLPTHVTVGLVGKNVGATGIELESTIVGLLPHSGDKNIFDVPVEVSR